MYIIELLQEAAAVRASDLHVSSGQPVAFRRTNGDLVFDEGYARPSDEHLADLFSTVLSVHAKARFERAGRLDAAIELPTGPRIRLRLFKHAGGWAAACRLLPTKIRSLGSIQAPAVIENSLADQSGLIIVSGPTGSGKSSTLAAAIDYINRTFRRRVVTVEDPIEYLHKSILSLVTQKEVPRDVLTFEDALMDSLREDANVLMIGELRDARSLRAAMTAADTGLLVLATLHARNTPSAVGRLIDAFPSGEKDLARSMLADSLRLFIAQALVKTADGSERVAAFETLASTPAVRNLIRTGDLAQLPSAIQTGGSAGMMTLKQSIEDLLRGGTVDPQDADRILRGRHG
jgi:twitching motility protein PilT